MDRRNFLSTTILSSVGFMASVAQAKAFTTQSCDGNADLPCRELIQHRDLVVQLGAALSQKGLTDDQRRAVLANAKCPFCGQLLLDWPPV